MAEEGGKTTHRESGGNNEDGDDPVIQSTNDNNVEVETNTGGNNEDGDDPVVQSTNDINVEVETNTEIEETKRLRCLIKLYFYTAIRWKNGSFHIHYIYFLLLILQTIKLFAITKQIKDFGLDRSNFNYIVCSGHLTLRHLFLKDWDASWETLPYPPAHGDFAVYDINSLEEHINYAVERYYNADREAIGFYKRRNGDEMVVKMKYFDFIGFTDTPTSDLEVKDIKFPVDKGLTVPPENTTDKHTYDITKEFAHHNISLPFKRLLSVNLEFTIYSIRVFEFVQNVRCLKVDGGVLFEDYDNNGQVVVNVVTDTSSIPCSILNYSIPDWNSGIKSDAIGGMVVVCCALSLLSTILLVVFGILLCWKTKVYMKTNYSKETDTNENDFPWWEYRKFIQLWDFTVMLSDGFTLYGTSWIPFGAQDIDWDLTKFDSITVFLSLGCLFAWLSFLRLFRFTKRFNVLFSTLYHATLDVLVYLICIVILFIGFWISGYMVLGPYHVKFRTPGKAAETLLSIVTGDEIFTTLNILEHDKTGGNWVWWFLRFYIVFYVSIFTVVIFNILIAIFLNAYESVKKDSGTKRENEDIGPDAKKLKYFLEKPKSDNQPSKLCDSMRKLMSGKIQSLSEEEQKLKDVLLKITGMTSDRKVLKGKPNTLARFMEEGEDAKKEIKLFCLKISIILFSEKERVNNI